MEDALEVVYYSQPVPSSWETFATLALVFDRIHFPGVYIGSDGLDEAAAAREVERVRGLLAQSPQLQDAQLLNCMVVALHHKHLAEFCVFPGSHGQCGTLEPGADELMMKLEELYFGPPPPGFHPSPTSGFAKGLPGEARAGVNAPAAFCYPGNAFLYAVKHGLPCINDDPGLPLLAPPIPTLKNNTQALATLVAIESVRLALPRVKPLTPADIHELRERTRDDVRPFRRAVRKLAKAVNESLDSSATMEEALAGARHVVETEVEPQLEELRSVLRDPGRHWTRRLIDLTAPAVILAAGGSNWPDRIRGALAGLLPFLVAEAEAQRHRMRLIQNSGLQFLLKLKEGR